MAQTVYFSHVRETDCVNYARYVQAVKLGRMESGACAKSVKCARVEKVVHYKSFINGRIR